MSIVRTARAVLERDGLIAFVRRALAWTLQSCSPIKFRRLAFFEVALANVRIPTVVPPAGVELCVATPEYLARHARQLEESFEIDSAEAKRRLERGDVAILAVHDDALVAMKWVTFGIQAVSEIGMAVHPKPNEAVGYNDHTLPGWRGLGLCPLLTYAAWEIVRARGFARVLSWRRLNNSPALRVAAKLSNLGLRRIGTVTAVKIIGLETPLVFGLSADGLPLLQWSSKVDRARPGVPGRSGRWTW